MKSSLIVARSGKNSLHPAWLIGEQAEFDLVVTFYGDVVPDEWRHKGYKIIAIKGSKWRGLYQYLKSDESWKNYDQIFLPDDDLLFNAATINQFLDVAKALKADLCQPALDEKSYISHLVTSKCPSFKYRITNFVELMCPCFSRKFLELSLELFNESDSGWGMDYYWYHLLRANRLAMPIIVDGAAVTHTRPVGAAGHGGSMTPLRDIDNLMRKFQFKRHDLMTLGGELINGKFVDASIEKCVFQISMIKDLFSMNARNPTDIFSEIRRIALM